MASISEICNELDITNNEELNFVDSQWIITISNGFAVGVRVIDKNIKQGMLSTPVNLVEGYVYGFKRETYWIARVNLIGDTILLNVFPRPNKDIVTKWLLNEENGPLMCVLNTLLKPDEPKIELSYEQGSMLSEENKVNHITITAGNGSYENQYLFEVHTDCKTHTMCRVFDPIMVTFLKTMEIANVLNIPLDVCGEGHFFMTPNAQFIWNRHF